MFILKCPKCGNTMKYNPLHGRDFSKKRKQCVYCGKSYSVRDHIIKKE